MSVEANVLDLELPDSLQGAGPQSVERAFEDEAADVPGAKARGPRPKRTYNPRTRRNELVAPDARKARNKRQRQARKATRGR